MNTVESLLCIGNIVALQASDFRNLVSHKKFFPKHVSGKKLFQIVEKNVFELICIHLFICLKRHPVDIESIHEKLQIYVRLPWFFEVYEDFFKLKNYILVGILTFLPLGG